MRFKRLMALLTISLISHASKAHPVAYSTFDSCCLVLDSVGQLASTLPDSCGLSDVLGYYAPGDGGGGNFYWNAASTATPVQGMIVKVTSLTTGRWFRRYTNSGYFPIAWFGGIISANINTDTTTDNTIPLRTAMKYIFDLNPNFTNNNNGAFDQATGAWITFSNGFYRFTDSVQFIPGIGIQGAGRAGTVFVADMENKTTFQRTPSYRSLFICYMGNIIPGGGTFGNNAFKDFSITSSYSTGGNTVPFHWTLKNGIELRNGFYDVEDININSSDSAGIYAFDLIQTVFKRVRIDNCGAYGFWLSFDPSNPSNTTTTTNFLDCYFRTTRRGPGFFCNGPVISSGFFGGILENNGLEDSTAGQGALFLGDSTNIGNFKLYTVHFAFYGTDFERNCAEKVKTDCASVLIDQSCRYTGQPAQGISDMYFRNSVVSWSNRWYQGNVPSGATDLIVSSNTPTSSLLQLDLPEYNPAEMTFYDGSGIAHPYNWLTGMKLFCLQSNGVGFIGYTGNETSDESWNLRAYADSVNLGTTVIPGSASPHVQLIGMDTLTGRLYKDWKGPSSAQITTALGYIPGTNFVTVTSSYAALTNYARTIINLNATSGTITLPDPTQAASQGKYYLVRVNTTGQTATVATVADSIEVSLGVFAPTATVTTVPAQGWVSDGTNWRIGN